MNKEHSNQSDNTTINKPVIKLIVPKIEKINKKKDVLIL